MSSEAPVTSGPSKAMSIRVLTSPTFFDWLASPTDSSPSSSPTYPFIPGLASSSSTPTSSPETPLSPLSPSPTPPSPSPSPSPDEPTPLPLTWQTAAADAAAGIYYVLEAFPSSGVSLLGPPFRNEPLKVPAGARVAVLEEVGDHALRVRIVDTGAVGLLPAWDVEGALERLARLNMEFNEAATCPEERKILERRREANIGAAAPSSAPHAAPTLVHRHDRCVSFATRLSFRMQDPFLQDPDDDPDSANSELDDYFARGDREPAHKGPRARKAVEFATEDCPKVFRYPSEAVFAAHYGKEAEAEGAALGKDEEGEREEGDKEWYWAGWEEHQSAEPSRDELCELVDR
ncbi:hypothetical protein WOLCODRAFT_162184 [Wolfiporia cocos MD-104 SS10]|uniref:Uncharacterized protein n=1 Tax=Wolfiporia cocos (strain MD-104) TaxID=742152 RepID=A0A2H3JVN4_WOLCO|nr:hypothetical protein WOLCODRAFT_162184 [Wolfiporia cocos MD-104 SS10]